MPRRRRLAWRLAAVALGLVLLVLAVAHMPFARALVLERAAAWLRSSSDIELSASGLRYNLFSLTAELGDVSLSATGTPGEPFATAAAVQLVFGWRTILGRVDVRRVTIESPTLSVRRLADGSDNLPKPGDSTATPQALTLPDIRVVDLDVDIVLPDVTISMQDVVAELASPSAGTIDLSLRAATGLSIAAGATTVTAESAAAELSYDGRTLTVGNFTAARPGTSIRAAGTIDVAGDAPEVDLALEVAADLASWAAELPEITGLAGQVEGRATVAGLLSNPVVTADVTGQDLRWSTVEAPTAHATGTLRDGVLEIDTLAATVAGGTVDGRGRIALEMAGEDNVADVRWSTVDLAQLLNATASSAAVMTSGTAAIEWHRAGVPDSPLVTRVVATTALRSNGETVNLALRASGSGPAWRVDIEPGAGETGDLRAGADIVLDDRAWTDSTVTGALTLAAPDVQRMLTRVAAFGVPLAGLDVSSVSGAADLAATFEGTLGHIRAAGSLDGRTMTIMGSPAFDLTTTFALDGGNRTSNGQFRMALPDLSAWAETEFPGLRLRGGLTATGGWSGAIDDPVATVDLTGTDLSATLPAGSPSATGALALAGVSIIASVDGTLGDLRGEATLAIDSAQVGRQALGRLDTGVRFEGGSAAVRTSAPGLGTTLEAEVGLAAPYAFRGRATMQAAELARLAGAAGISVGQPGDLAGTVGGSADFRGSLEDLAASSANVTMSLTDVAILGVPVRAPDVLRATVGGGRARIDQVALTVGAVSINVTGEFQTDGPDGHLHLAIDGDPGSLSPWLARLDGDAAWTAEGRLTASLDAARSATGLHVTGTIESALARVSRGDLFAENVQLAIDLDGTHAEVRQLTATVPSGSVEVTARAPLYWLNEWLPSGAQLSRARPDERGVLDATATFDVAAALAHAGVSPQQDLRGIVTVAARLEADRPALDAATGVVTIERGELSTLSQTFAQVSPTVLRLADRRLTIEAFEWRGAGGEMKGRGFIGLAEGAETDFSIALDTTLGILDTFLPGRSSGSIRGTFSVTGRAGDWRVATEATIEKASWLLPESRLFFADWSGRLQIDDEALVVTALEGQLNGGTVTVSGRLPFGPGAEADGLTITAREVLVDIPRGLHSQLVADLRWHPRNGASVLRGSMTATSNRYREPVTRMLEMVDALAAAGRGSSAEERTLPEWLSAVELDVAFGVTDPVVIDNSLGNVELVPDLRLTGTLGNPALAGQIGIIDDGRIRIGGRSYRLRESTLRFVPAEGLAPTLDVIGETLVGGYDIVLRISGTPDRIETAFTSSPPLSERDLRSLLVTGRVEGAGESTDDFAMGAAATDILGFAGKFVGLDSVRLGSADLDIVSKGARTAQHLTVSKSFGRKFELILSENLEDGPLTWVLVWKPVPGYEFRFASVENTEQTVEFRQELLFGPGAARATSAGRTSAASAAPPARIDGIVFTGSPGFDETELLDTLRLEPGGRFDIRRWIDDRQRLEEFYRDRNYHRVRIVPTRTELDPVDGTRRLSLAYDIDRGPRTVIDVTGDDLPDEALDEMYRQWGGVPIAEILREEFERVARDELALRGYLRAEVRVDFPTVTEELEQAVLRVERGARSRRQVILWIGNRAVPTADLDAIAAGRPVETNPWTDPSALVRDVRNRYAERGYFDAEVSVLEPRFDGDTATLPVEIVEGIEARVASVRLEGVDASRLEAARAAVGLTEGTTFGSASALEANRALETFYANLGYRDARVTDEVARSPDGSVDITLRVDEGRLHVVNEVRVSGVESTNPGLVDRAVTLAPGAEASRQRAEDTRSNLYDIGTFRQVNVTFEPSALDVQPGETVPVWASVAVEEPRKYQLRYGIQVSSNYTPSTGLDTLSAGGTVELRDRNFLGRALQASIGARYDKDIQMVALLLSAPRTFGRAVRTNFYARDRREITDSESVRLEDHSQEFTFEQRWRPRAAFEVAWSYLFEYRDYRLSVPGSPAVEDFDGFLAGPTVSVILDHRDDPFDARRGWFHSSSLQGGLEWLGSDVEYIRYLGRQTYYLSLGPVTLAGGGRWGTLDSYSGDAPLSALDLFFTAGGTNTVRGYPEGALSAVTFETVDVDGEVFTLAEPLRLGGTELLVLNGEVRYPIFRWFSGVVFVDGGNTFLGWKDISLAKMAAGGGLGIRIRTPLAPLRFDFAYPLTTGFGYRGLRIHFSIGQMF